MILIFKFIQPTTDNTSKQVFNFSLPSSSFVVYTTNHNFLIHLHLLKRFFISHLFHLSSFHQTRPNSFNIFRFSTFRLRFHPIVWNIFPSDRLKRQHLKTNFPFLIVFVLSIRHIEEILPTLPSSSFLSYLLFSQINSYILQEEWNWRFNQEWSVDVVLICFLPSSSPSSCSSSSASTLILMICVTSLLPSPSSCQLLGSLMTGLGNLNPFSGLSSGLSGLGGLGGGGLLSGRLRPTGSSSLFGSLTGASSSSGGVGSMMSSFSPDLGTNTLTPLLQIFFSSPNILLLFSKYSSPFFPIFLQV